MRNYRCKTGEIDIISQSGDGFICFVEVKYRSNKKYGTAIEAVTPQKQAIIRKVALHFLTYYIKDINAKSCFDVIAIDRLVDDYKITHIHNAF